MPEPLVCEDTSLDRLLEKVNQTPGARILYQDTVRRGGVLGFFAREVHRVAYLADPAATGLPAADRVEPVLDLLAADEVPTALDGPAATEVGPVLDVLAGLDSWAEAPADPLAALLAEADADEAAASAGTGVDFAAVLRQYLPDPAEGNDAVAVSTPVPSNPVPSGWPELSPDGSLGEPMVGPAEFVTDQPLAPVTSITGRGEGARERLELLVQLRQVGVPVSINPAAGVPNVYQALEEIVEQLPEPAPLPNRAGQVLAIAGDATPALRAAEATARLLRQPADQIVVAGLAEADAPGLRRLNGRRQAARLRREAAEADLPLIVVVATDGAGPEDTWAADLLDALRPDLTWAVLDARWKSEDCLAALQRFGVVQALVVHGAELSASPATVWDLDLPLALLDERRPSRVGWLSLLIRLVGREVSSHRASA